MKARPSEEALLGVICVSGEYRFSLGVFPKSSQFEDVPLATVVAEAPPTSNVSADIAAKPIPRMTARRIAIVKPLPSPLSGGTIASREPW